MKKLPIVLLDLAKSFFREIHKIHFVHNHNDLVDAEHAEQISVAPALFAHAFVCADNKDRCVRSRRARDHVLQKFLVPRRIDDRVTAACCSKRNLGGVDGDVLLLFLEKRIEQKREFKLHPFGCAGVLYFFDLPFRQRAGVVENAPDERGLAVIHMTDEDDAELRFKVWGWTLSVGR